MKDRRTGRRKIVQRLKVDEVYDGVLGVSAFIYYDKDDGIFFSPVGPEDVEAPTQAECRPLTRDALQRHYALSWAWRICVRSRANGYNGHGYHQPSELVACAQIDLNFDKHELAQRPDGTWLQRLGPYPTGFGYDDYKYEEYRLRCDAGFEEKIFLFTDALWNGLTLLQRKIEEAGEQLRAILRAADAVLQLEGLADTGRLLPLPSSHHEEVSNDG